MSSGRRRTTDRLYSAEDQALDQISKEAEERIQARRQARAEAREIRLREIERQQKEEEDRQKPQQQATDSKSISNFSGSRRGSNDSTESHDSTKDSKDPKDQARQLKHQLRELEDKYKAAMVTNAQLDNTKTSQVFQLELLKEQLEEQEEGMIEVQREYKDKCRDYDLLKRDHENLKLECDGIKLQIELKDKLLKESGLVIVATDEGEFSLTKCSNLSDVPIPELGSSIISEEAADLLKKAGEGTLGNSKESVDTLDSQIKISDSVVDKEVAGDTVVNLNKNEVIANEKSSSSEDLSAAESVVDERDTKSIGIDDENNNDAENREIENNSDVVKDNRSEIVSQEESNINYKSDDERQDNIDKGGDESDENEVFYESKSEVSLVDKDEKGESSEIVSEDVQKEKEMFKVKVESAEMEEGTEFANYDREREHEGEEKESKGKVDKIHVNEKVKENKTEIIESLAEQTEVESVCEGAQRQGPESESFDLIRKPGGSLTSFRNLKSESVISFESDVTYHSESEDIDFFVDAEKENLGESSNGRTRNIDKLVAMVDDEEIKDTRIPADFLLGLDSDRKESPIVAVESNVECRVDRNSKEVNVAEPNVENSDLPGEGNKAIRADSEEDSKQLDKGKLVLKSELGSSISESEVCTTPSQNDEVFMSLPLDKLGYEQDMIQFAKNYVTDIVLKSVDMYNNQLKDEKIMVRKQSYTSANVDISIPKRHYSEELVDTASAVIPRKLSSGSVEILSPVVHLPSEKNGDLKFFTYKVDADADVVLTSIEEEKNPLEGMVTMDSLQSPISGFGICYSGVEGHSDIDSEVSDDSSNEGADELGPDIGSPGVVDFISMPVAINDEEGEEKEIGESKIETLDTKTETLSEDKDINDEVSSIKKLESENEDDSVEQDKDINKVVSNELAGSSCSDGKREEIRDKGDREGINNEVAMSNDINDKEKKEEVHKEEEINVKEEAIENLSGEKGIEHDQGATGVNIDETEQCNVSKDKTEKAISSENVSESGSRLSGELSPHEEGGQSADSGNMSRKKSKKKGAKKHSKDECCLS